MVSIATQHKGPKITTEDGNHSGTHEPIVSVVDRAQIPFPSFDGSNYREWKAKSEQFFELEKSNKVGWQRHYMQNVNNKHKTWRQILQDVGNQFDTSAFNNLMAELARLKQEDSLIEYLERFDTLLTRIAISKESWHWVSWEVWHILGFVTIFIFWYVHINWQY